jgi:hypothetical protein
MNKKKSNKNNKSHIQKDDLEGRNVYTEKICYKRKLYTHKENQEEMYYKSSKIIYEKYFRKYNGSRNLILEFHDSFIKRIRAETQKILLIKCLIENLKLRTFNNIYKFIIIKNVYLCIQK